MKITINGEELEIDANISVTTLLTIRQVKMPHMLTVHLNGNILKQETFDDVLIKEGDEVEFLFFMGGGGTLKE